MVIQNISLPLPSDLVAILQTMALERDEAFEDLVRGMLDREVTRLRSTRASLRAQESRIARLRLLLAPDMRRARSWGDLQSALALYSVELRPGQRALTLHDRITGEPLCPSDALGFTYPELMRRFGGPLTDEPRTATAA